jgi:hypothetical protein
MAIWVGKKATEFEVPPEGLHPAVCCDVVDLGIVDWGFGPQVKIRVVWQLEEANSKGKRFVVSAPYTPSLHEKSKLRPILEAWRGKKFTKEEIKKFNIELLLGANCQVMVTHNIKDGGDVYANVQAVVPPAKNAKKIYVDEDYTRVKDRPGYQEPNNAIAEESEEPQQSEDDDDVVPF